MLGYLGWMLRDSGLSLTTSDPKALTKLVQEPDPDNINAPGSKRADQPTPDPGAVLKLIDLWSADPVPTQIPNIEFSPSSPVPYEYLDALVVPDFSGPNSPAGHGQSTGSVGPTGVV